MTPPPATPSSYRHCARPSSLLQFWRCTPEEDVLVQDQFDSREDVEGVVYHQSLFYVHEIIKIELTIKKTRDHVARKYYGDLQLFSIPTHRQKGTSYNLILVIINRLTCWKNLSMNFVTNCLYIWFGRVTVTIRSSSLWAYKGGTQWANVDSNRCTPAFPTRLSETETQFSPSSGARGTIFRLGYGYTSLTLTAVTIYAFFTKILNRNLITA